MFYILSSYYEPNSATTNHALSFIKGFSDLGVNAQWVFLIPDKNQSRWDTPYKGITVRYLWNGVIAKNRVLRYLYLQIAYAFFYLCVLKEGDVVLLLNTFNYLHGLVRRKGIRVYHERTEHPDAFKWTQYKFIDKNYIKDCTRVSGLFLISSALKQYFESMGVPSEKCHVINMVVDSNRFNGIIRQKNIQPYIAYCGNASNSKDGVDDLIKAFALITQKNSSIKLYIAGKPPLNESDNFKLVEELGIKDRIVFLGMVSANDIPQLLVNAQVLALCRPSSLQNKYGFPTKLGEYLLTGNPVAITKVGDIPLFLKHRESAMLSECGDIESFAENVLWLLDNPKDAMQIGQNGRVVADTFFNYLTETIKMRDIMFA